MEIIKDWWAVIVALAGIVVWAVRVESGMKGNRGEIQRLWKQREEDIQNAKESREETNKLLREMREDQREARNDIKRLLERG